MTAVTYRQFCFVAVDHCTGECIGIHASLSGNRFEAEHLLWVRHFASVAELIEALREFWRRYNEHWLIERHGYRTPSQARPDLCSGARALEARAKCRRAG